MPTRQTNVFLNIQDKYEYLLYKTQVPDYAVNSAFVVSERVASGNSVQIINTSTELPGNRIEGEVPRFLTTNGFTTQSEYFLLTDVFVQDVNDAELPLYFKHIIDQVHLPRTDDILLDIDSDYTLINAEILDGTFKVLKTAFAYVDYAKGIIYSNFMNSYVSPQNYSVYYVQYSVRNNVSGSIYTYTELLAQENVYRLADWDDLDEFFNLKIDGRKVYTIEQILNTFSIRIPSGTRIAWQHATDARIFVKEPPRRTTSDPWYVRVSNGAFFHQFGALLYKYRIAEFLEQGFYPYSPLKTSTQEIGTVIGKSLIKSDYESLVLDETEDLHLEVVINKADGTAIGALTTDDNKVGLTASNGELFVKWNETTKLGIKSIDKLNGIIEVGGFNLRLDDEVILSYIYEEKFYEFSLVDLNPLTNRNMVSNKLILFIEPELFGSETSQSLYYILIDNTGLVVDTNWPELNLGGDPIYYNSLPRHHSPPAPPIAYVNFVDTYTSRGSGTAFIIGEVSIIEPSRLQDILLIDTRIEGGGIKETRLEEALILAPETRWFHDIGTWDGVPYPGLANYLVEIPADISVGGGGVLPPAEIREIIDRHTAFGVYGAIRQYAPEVTITDILPTPDSVILTWEVNAVKLRVPDPLDDSELAYNIYYRSEFQTHWTLANVNPLVDANPNTYEITGLDTSVVYYVLVIPGKLDDGEMTEYIRQPILPNGDTSLHINALADMHFPLPGFMVKLPLR